jgi:hypothetical protein
MLNEDQIGECLAKYNPDLLAQCLKVGVRVFLYGLAGYSPKSLEKFDLKYQVGIQFNNGYYWEIPTDYHNAMKIAELAQDMAGQDIDGIVVFFGEYQEMAILTEDRGRRSIATSFGAAFAANKLCRR